MVFGSMVFFTVDVMELSAMKVGFTRCDDSNKALLRLGVNRNFVPLLTLRHMFCSSSTIFTSAVTQSGSKGEKESL